MDQKLSYPNVSYENINAQCCCFHMRKVMRAVTQYFDRHLEGVGIRATQFTLLIELSSTKAKTLTEIAEGLVMDRTTLTRNLKPLEKSGFITTVQPIDKRSKAYVLTDKGKDIVNRAVPLWQAAQSGMVNSMGAERYQRATKEIDALLAVTIAQKNWKK